MREVRSKPHTRAMVALGLVAVLAATVVSVLPATAAPAELDSCNVFYDDVYFERGESPNPALHLSWANPGSAQGVVFLNGVEYLTTGVGDDEAFIEDMPLNRITHVSVALRDGTGQGPRRYCGYIYTSDNFSPDNAPALPAPGACAVATAGDDIVFTVAGADYISQWDLRINGRRSSDTLFGYTDDSGTLVDQIPVGLRDGVEHFSLRASGFQKPSAWVYCGRLDFGSLGAPARVATCNADNSFLEWSEAALATSYRIYVNGRVQRTVDPDRLSASMEPPRPGTTNHYSVAASNGSGTAPRTYCGYEAAPG